MEPDPQPPYDVTENNQNSLAVVEGGALFLPVGQLEVPILFSQDKISTEYDIIEHDISNETDIDPLEITYNFTERTVEGFRLILDSAPDTGNYKFRYRVSVPSL